MIAEHRLNRVVVASCTPGTGTKPIFRDTLRDAGLNPFLLEMANIRDQCSWVHSGAPDQATEKAVHLVPTMAMARTARLTPFQQEMVPVNNAALVIGGGVAGMTAAITLADQGFPVHLVEKDTQLGGTARQLHHTLDGRDIQAFLAEAISHVTNHPRITVYLGSHAGKVEGHIGNFHSTITGNSTPIEIQHGAIVVATGATEEKPRSFGYGQNPRVITQLGTDRSLGTRRDFAARKCHGGDDSNALNSTTRNGRIAADVCSRRCNTAVPCCAVRRIGSLPPWHFGQRNLAASQAIGQFQFVITRGFWP